MNLILLFPSDFIASSVVRLSGRRFNHVCDILKPVVNDELVVGLEGGNTGIGRVTSVDPEELVLEVSFIHPPPVKLPVILCLALMRPIVLKRVVQTAVSMGVEAVIFFHSNRVEKSFWQSTALGHEELREQMILGLEQAKDTVLPELFFHKKFKPFVEDALPGLLKGRRGIAADPGGSTLACRDGKEPLVLLIGPEGGFIPYEIEKLKAAGCSVVAMGPRILKVETAIVALLAKFFY